MKGRPAKRDKKEIREETHLTRPPRLEGKVNKASMRQKKKPKQELPVPHEKSPVKSQESHTRLQRKEYHLKSPKPKR